MATTPTAARKPPRRTPSPIDINLPVGANFERRVGAHPDRIAIQTKTAAISYDALNREANAVAHRILAAPGSPGDRVALLVDHGAGAIAAFLGALKAHRVYVPIDTTYPRPRVEYILRDCRASMVITQDKHAGVVADMAAQGTRVLNLDNPPGARNEENPGVRIDAGEIAYILYTSGSTGEPKGVPQTHRNLQHFVRSYASSLGIVPEDRLTLFYSLSFSAALMDIYGGLLTGATVLPHPIKEEGIAGLSDWLTRERVTVYHSVPTVFRSLLESVPPEKKFADIRVIDLGGEPVFKRDVEMFRKHFEPGTLLVNHLAATEASVIAQHFITHDTPIETANAPTGVAADGVEIALLDEHGQPVPDGEPGEITVRSRFLCPGYWNKPELSAKAFTSVPGDPTLRQYHTGDLARLGADGHIEHLGRRDFRVKIRGITIEVAEIESALTQIAGVKDARVLAREFGPGDPRLVAYIIAGASPAPAVVDIRAHLRKKLPEAMVPAAYIWLNAFPLNPNGKVDNRAMLAMPLPAEPAVAAASEDEPLSDIEAHLTRIWRTLLKTQRVGLDDNFFDLGGHSLLAMKMFAQVEVELGRRIMINLLAEAPTIRKLAQAITKLDASGASTILVPIQPRGEQPPIFFIGPDHLLYFARIAQRLGDTQPLFGLQPPYPDGFRIDNVTVEQMASLYVDEIDKLGIKNGCHLVGFCGGGVIAYEAGQRLIATGHEVRSLTLIDSPRHFHNIRDAKVGMPRYYSRRVLFHLRVASGLPWPESAKYLLSAVSSMMRTIGKPMGADHVAPPGHTAAQRALLDANRRAFLQYEPKPYPRRLDLILAGDTFAIYRTDPRLAWSELAPGRTRSVWAPGGHQSVLMEPGLSILVHHLQVAIGRG